MNLTNKNKNFEKTLNEFKFINIQKKNFKKIKLNDYLSYRRNNELK